VRADVFLDTGIFVALLVRDDRAHPAAVELFSELPRSPVTSLAVVAEGYAYFLHRFNEDRARQFRQLLSKIPGLKLLAIDGNHHSAVLRKLDRLRGIKLTYVDASSLVFLQQHRISAVWGTDCHLSIEGARVLPFQDAD
jgi:predicted nucleic acid-binding protein